MSDKIDFKNPTPEMIEMLKRTASSDVNIRAVAERQVALSMSIPIREAILDGDITDGIFTAMKFDTSKLIEFPLDFVTPGSERDFIAYTIPNAGEIPYRNVEGDYLTVSTYDVGVSLDWNLKYARDARWDVIGKAKRVIDAMVRLKINRDAWRLLIAMVVDRGLVYADSAAPAGFFSKRLMTVLKTSMQRAGGGNLTSINQIKLTDVYLSPEAVDDALGWDLTQIPDAIRTQIYNSGDLITLYKVKLNPMNELGVGQYLQSYYEEIGGTYNGSDTELVVALDKSQTEMFVMPVRAPFELFEDTNLHRSRRQGFYGWQEHGFAGLDNRLIAGGTF